MDTSIIYMNNAGESVILGGEAEMHYFANEVHDYAWTAETSGKTTTLKREARTFSLPIGIWADSEEQGMRLREKVFSVTEADRNTGEPGYLIVGNWWIRCFITASAKEDWWYADNILKDTWTVYAPDAVWRSTVTLRYNGDVAEDYAYLDYPHDEDYDYSLDRQTVDNTSGAVCDFIWTVYGPAEDPRIVVGGNSYQVMVTVPARYRLVVDSEKRTIVLYDEYGDGENVYYLRVRGAKGSGKYIFEPIPYGEVTVAWDRSFEFDLTLRYGRSEPAWDFDGVVTEEIALKALGAMDETSKILRDGEIWS